MDGIGNCASSAIKMKEFLISFYDLRYWKWVAERVQAGVMRALGC